MILDRAIEVHFQLLQGDSLIHRMWIKPRSENLEMTVIIELFEYVREVCALPAMVVLAWRVMALMKPLTMYLMKILFPDIRVLLKCDKELVQGKTSGFNFIWGRP